MTITIEDAFERLTNENAALKSENKKLKEMLAEAADWIDNSADIIDEEGNDDMDGEVTEAHEVACAFRQLAGVQEKRPNLHLYRVDHKGHRAYVVAGCVNEAVRYVNDTTALPQPRSWRASRHDVELASSFHSYIAPLSLSNEGLHAPIPDSGTCNHEECDGSCACQCVCHGWPGETTKTLEAWIKESEAGLLWVTPARCGLCGTEHEEPLVCQVTPQAK